MNDTVNTKKAPDLNIFAKSLNSDGTSKISKQVGVAWSHQKGEGFNIILDVIPIPNNNRIELVAFAADKNEE